MIPSITPTRRWPLRVVSLLALPLALVACGSSSADDFPPVTADDCVLWLHGRSERGGPTMLVDGVAHIRPDGNDRAESGRQWQYAEPDDLADALGIVRDAVDATECQQVVVHGFSNGAAFAAKIYCSGDDFEGRLRGVVIDDPVTDASSAGCAPADDVAGVLYWTTALEAAGGPGAKCADIGSTCEGPIIVGIDAYSEALGLPALPSIHTDHVVYADPPEHVTWLVES